MKYLSIAALAAVGAIMMGCNEVEISTEQPQQDEELVTSNTVTLTTTVDLDATTKALTSGGVKTFAEGETMAVIYDDEYGETHKAVSTALTAGDITNEGKSATFTFELTDPDKDENVTYIYPAAMANDNGSVNYGALDAQDGTLATLASTLDLATYTSAWNGDNLPSATLANQLAILALTLKDADGSNDLTSTITGVTVSDGANTYTVTRSAAAGPIYVAIRPVTTATDIEVTATDGTTDYAKSLTGKTYAAGNGYSLSWRMATAPTYTLLSAATTADYGMVVCAAGHLHDAKTAVPAGCTAVGIIGKVTETGHGLILALQDATSQTWNTIDGWASVTTYAGTTLKVLPDDAARGTNLTSYTTLGATTVSNWAVAQKSDYEAIFTNLGSTEADKDGTTYDANVNAFITTGVGGSAISGSYWSTTEVNSANAWRFNSYYWNYDDKTVSYSVRPVLSFGDAPGVTYTLLSTATTSDYGKVVCAAGHLHDAKTAVPAGCTAVGILGKVTETGHGLILALQDATSQTWNTINGWTSVTTYAGTTLKVLPNDAARGTNLTSYTTLGATAVSNWAVAQKSDYEAIFTNLGSTTGDKDGKTYDANVNAFITTGVGGSAISGDYWSATERIGYDGPWYFRDYCWFDGLKSDIDSVRPVLGF